MTAPTGLPHLEQAKVHLRNANYILSHPNSPDSTLRQLIWAIDEVVRYVEGMQAPRL